MKDRSRLVAQLLVLVPTLATSAWLGHIGVTPLPRFGMSLGVGMVAIMLVAVWQRGRPG